MNKTNNILENHGVKTSNSIADNKRNDKVSPRRAIMDLSYKICKSFPAPLSSKALDLMVHAEHLEKKIKDLRSFLYALNEEGTDIELKKRIEEILEKTKDEC